MNDDDESMLPPAGPEAEESSLRLLEDILYNRIMQKKQEMHRTDNRAYTDHLWTEEIETLQWYYQKSSIRRRQQDGWRYYYYYYY